MPRTWPARSLLSATLAAGIAFGVEPTPMEPPAPGHGTGLLGSGAPDPAATLSPSRQTSEAAIAALIADPKSGKALVEAWISSKDPRQRAVAARVGAAIGGAKSLPGLMALAQDKQVSVRRAVAATLDGLTFTDDKDRDSRALIELLAKLAGDADIRVRIATVQRLGRCNGSKAAARILLAAWADAPEEVSEQAIAGLIALETPKLIDQVYPRLGDPKVPNRVLAANALGRIGGGESVQRLLGALDACAGNSGPMWEARAAICDAIAEIAPADPPLVAKVEKALVPLLVDKKWGVRAAAAWALGRVGSKSAVLALVGGVDPLDAEPFHSVLKGLTDQPWTTMDEWKTWWKKEGAAAQPHAIPPPAAESTITYWSIEETTANVVFVIDHSGSMAETGMISQYHQKDKEPRSKLEMAERELLRTALTLNPGTRFNVVQFSGAAEAWHDGPLHATWRAKAKLKDWVESLGPGGATNADDALSMGLDQWGVETLFFLTDGMPTTGEIDSGRIVQHACDLNSGLTKRARIHTVAFFVEEARTFLSGLAQQNDGQYRMIE